MRIIFLSIALVLLAFLACIEPERDGPYDPNNPNKPSLYGYTHYYDWSPLPGASIELRQDGDIKYSTQSNSEAWFEFVEINPGIYELYGEVEYYSPSIDTVYLYAGRNDTFDIVFDEIYLDFDNEVTGIQEPFGFTRIVGAWQIQEDNTAGDQHSIPNVYNAVHDATTDPYGLSLLRDTLEDFWMSVNIKALTSTSNWYAGLVLRYQDEDNYYLVQYNPGGLSLMKMRNGSSTQLASTSSYTFSSNAWYHISVYLHENKIKIYVDYDEVLEKYDTSSPLYSGLAGLWVYTSEPTGSAEANFDDVHVWP
jgi:hypothetical protein